MNDRVRHEFLRDASKKGAAKAFVESNAASALKTKPKVSKLMKPSSARCLDYVLCIPSDE